MKINREYFQTDKFYATVLVSIAVIAILTLMLARDSIQLGATSSKLIHRTNAPSLPPPDARPPEAYKPTKIRLKAVNKEATDQTLKDTN